MKRVLLAFSVLAIALTANAQKLDKFGADLGKKSVMGKDIRVPYTDVVTYFGYVAPGAAPDEVRDGKKYYYIYVWIPLAAPELGVRMASPVPEKMSAEEKDIQSKAYTEHKDDKTNFFDTWVTLERATDVMSLSDVATKGKTTKWMSYGSNDDSSEMPAQPSGSKYNSLMRVTSEASDPTKALVMGLYRVGFTTYKKGEVSGSFVAQVAAPVKLPGVQVSSSLEDIK